MGFDVSTIKVVFGFTMNNTKAQQNYCHWNDQSDPHLIIRKLEAFRCSMKDKSFHVSAQERKSFNWSATSKDSGLNGAEKFVISFG